jgi:hypothetical protein
MDQQRAVVVYKLDCERLKERNVLVGRYLETRLFLMEQKHENWWILGIHEVLCVSRE